MEEPTKGGYFSFNGQLADEEFQEKMFGAINDTSATLSAAELLVVELEYGKSWIGPLRRDRKQFGNWLWRRRIKPTCVAGCKRIGNKIQNLFS